MPKELNPDYNILYDACLFSLREAYQRYKNAVNDYLKWTFIDSEGNFSILSGYEERMEKINKLCAEVVRLQNRLKEIKDNIEEQEI